MIKRISLFLLVLFIFAFSLYLFLKKSEENTFIFWTIQLKPIGTNFIEKNISEFQKLHPGLKIVWVDIPIAEAQKRTLASILGGNPPDLINLNPDFSSLLAQKDVLEYFDESETARFEPSVIKDLTYNGKVFALPFYATSSVTLINKKCIKDYENLKTYDDIMKLKDVKCRNYFCLNLNENDTFARILNKYGIYNFENEKSKIKAEEIFSYFKEMYDKKIIPSDSLTMNHREVVEKYMTGNLGSVVVGGNFVKMVKDNAPSVYKNSVVSSQLTGDEGTYDIALMNFVIPKKAKNKELAREFLALITNKENQTELSKLTNVLPLNRFALQDNFFKCDKNSDLIARARCLGKIQLQNSSVKNFGYQNKKEINDIINHSLEVYILENNRQILDKMESEINSLQK